MQEGSWEVKEKGKWLTDAATDIDNGRLTELTPRII